MQSVSVKPEATYENEKVDTLGKAYSVCKMVFSPHGGDEYVFGTTEKIKTYWDSLTCSFDFNWYVFDTEEEMMAYLKETDRLYSESLLVAFHKVENCELDEPPCWKNAERFL